MSSRASKKGRKKWEQKQESRNRRRVKLPDAGARSAIAETRTAASAPSSTPTNRVDGQPQLFINGELVGGVIDIQLEGRPVDVDFEVAFKKAIIDDPMMTMAQTMNKRRREAEDDKPRQRDLGAQCLAGSRELVADRYGTSFDGDFVTKLLSIDFDKFDKEETSSAPPTNRVDGRQSFKSADLVAAVQLLEAQNVPTARGFGDYYDSMQKAFREFTMSKDKDTRTTTIMQKADALRVVVDNMIDEGIEDADRPLYAATREIMQAYDQAIARVGGPVTVDDALRNWTTSTLTQNVSGGLVFFAVTFEKFLRVRSTGARPVAPSPSFPVTVSFNDQQKAMTSIAAEAKMRIDNAERVRSQALRERDEQVAIANTEKSKHAQAVAELQRVGEALARITSAPKLVGQVLIRRAESVEINVRGARLEVAVPTVDGKMIEIGLGDMVRVAADTMQIIDVIPREQRSVTGQMVELTHAEGDRGECEQLGNVRLIALGVPAQEGDRVVLDETGTVALLNQGPDRSKNAFGLATGVSWADVGGQEAAKAALRDAIEAPVRDAELFTRFGRKRTKGVLLYGPPGCGKTLLGKAAATAMAELHGAEGGGAFHYVKGPELLDMFVGQTERNVRKIFSDARRYRKEHGHPCVVFIDEADAILGKRGGGMTLTSGSTMTATVVPQFLAEMDGLEDAGLFLLLATNRPHSLDAAVVRDGRIDRRILVGRPEKADVVSIAMRAMTGRPFDQEECAHALAGEIFDPARVVAKVRRHSKGELTDKLLFKHIVSGATVVGIVERAAELAMHDVGLELVRVEHVRRAARASFNEMMDVDHTEELYEVVGEHLADVAGVSRGTAVAL